ncbi:thermonuclease family protein [Coleofasciculus sp. FACHB-501]|uniref:thermonuclease family protein n=1 Tax=Cyanophyceae TaxID=3028117 RepID=UPI0016829AE1|nr:thermonuclease family protein [Coleofasciculus sp. FACHB-501]MBD1838905.1 thermonuclease family protein [Coleofasciculus sp. FACHB-501]
MRSLKAQHLIHALPVMAIAAMIGSIVYQQWQQTLQARPDYDSADAAPPRYPVKVTANRNPSSPQSENWQVQQVLTGESMIVIAGWKKEKLRLCGIDVPESLANESRNYLKKLVDQAKGAVIVIPIGRDRSNRMIGEVFVSANTRNPDEEKFLNGEMVMAGLAYHYSPYSSGCLNREGIIQAEEIARSEHRGIWLQSKDVLHKNSQQ